MLPQAKPQAFYAFTGLEDKVHRLQIETQSFFPFTENLRVPMAQPLADGILACSLEPGPIYPYPSWDGLVRGLVTRSKRPVPGVQIDASYTGRTRNTVSRQTRTWEGGSYNGRYALSFGSRLPADTEITMNFVAPDGARSRQEVRLSPGTSVFLDVELN